MCCNNGKTQLDALLPPPDPLASLMTGLTTKSRHFLGNIRKYNACFSMTSFGATKVISEGGFMPTFKVQGQIYHLAGSLLPPLNCEPKFLQIYFTGDNLEQVRQRCAFSQDVREEIILDLQTFLNQHNDYAKFFKSAIERMPDDDHKVKISENTLSLIEIQQ